MININEIDDCLDKAQFICTKSDRKTKYDFNRFTFPLKFASKVYRRELKLQEAEGDQQDLQILINKLNNDYNPTNQIKIKEKRDALEPSTKLIYIREEIINAFKKGIFPYIDGFQVETDEDTGEETDEKTDTTNMSELESEESAAQRNKQVASGIKILIPDQVLSRLPISSAQLNAGNNSKKLKNEIRQILYSLYRSKKLTKQIYKSLIDII